MKLPNDGAIPLAAERVLQRIARLRKEHTANAKAERWQANDTVSRKIREAWAQYHSLTNLKPPAHFDV